MFGAFEKNVFAKLLRKHARFAGIEVLTWCIMDNHFHILIRVPQREGFLAELMANGRKLFWQHLGALYTRGQVRELRREIDLLQKEERDGSKNERELADLLEAYTRRMADLSIFMQELKHSFSVWFNRKHDRRGTLWMERFKSVLLEGESLVLRKVAAYIDLNPIRAGLVKDPASYRWCGYGQAVGGNVEARRGLSSVHGYGRNEWRQIAAGYRALLYLEGVEVRNADGKSLRAGVSTEDFYRETANGGRESSGKRLAKRVRYFSDGAAIGSREFLEAVFERSRMMFGSGRKSGARKFRGEEWKGEGLYALRDLNLQK